MSPRRSSRPEVLAAGPAGGLETPTLDDPAHDAGHAAAAHEAGDATAEKAEHCTGEPTTPGDGAPACCPRLHEAVELVGKRWTGAILAVLLQGGPMRFSEIGQAVPALSDRLLSERVKELEKRGIVERRVGGASPARVEYELTPMGRDLAPALQELEAWAHRWLD